MRLRLPERFAFVGLSVCVLAACNPFGGDSSVDPNFRPGASSMVAIGVSPSTGTTEGGTSITIVGSGFQLGALVDLGVDACVSVLVVNPTTITCVIPVHAVGVVDVKVTNPDGRSSVLSSAFTYRYPAPTISSITPSTGTIAGGTSVTIVGDKFRAGIAAIFGGTGATCSPVTTPTQLLCTTPAHSAGFVDVTVTNDDGQSATKTNGFIYGPNVASISPSSGGTAGGAQVTLTGENFVNGATIAIGGTTCTSIVFTSSTSMTCIVPAHGTAEAVDVVVTNPDAGAGTLSNGFTYLTQAWTAMASSGLSARQGHSAVWTGSEMIVWGGTTTGSGYLNDGAVYNPSTNSWSAVNGTGAPDIRSGHTAVWTGSTMIVWGGVKPGMPPYTVNTGGIYDPVALTWAATSTAGNCPVARTYHTAVWATNVGKMIVWGGGSDPSTPAPLSSGAVYTPPSRLTAGDTWAATEAGPMGRLYHTAVWTGSEMIVWGGLGMSPNNDGSRYTPGSPGSWTAIGVVVGIDARYRHTAVWTGSKMIVWGGNNGSTNFNSGAIYTPGGSLTPTSTTSAPAKRADHAAVWAGINMIVWGGYDSTVLNTGGIYNLAGDSWTTSIVTTPSARRYSPMVWTGNQALIWGGYSTDFESTGYRLDP